jgi:hypothetical protein
MGETEITLQETRTIILERVKPGDNWKSVIFKSDVIFKSLTDALEFHFNKTGDTDFFISARKGIVEIIKTSEVVIDKPITKYSLYGEE